MPQIRVEKKNDFTMLQNELLQNPGLSLKAKGLLAYMLSVPSDWDYSISGLSSKCKEGKAAIRAAISELIEAGYVTRSLARGSDGTLTGYEYVVSECPRPSCENCTTVEVQPSCDFPTSDNPSSENCTQQINNLTKEELNKAPPYIPPAGGSPPEGKTGRRKRGSQEPYKPEWFDAFWAKYPRKDNKQVAFAAWCKLRPDRETCRAMAAGLERAKKSRQWIKDNGDYIPLASTWINQRQWTNQGVDLSLLPTDGDSGGWAPDPEVTT